VGPTDQDKHLPWGKRRYVNALTAFTTNNPDYPNGPYPNLIGPVSMWETSNTLSKFNELATQIVYHGSRVTLQASYTLMFARRLAESLPVIWAALRLRLRRGIRTSHWPHSSGHRRQPMNATRRGVSGDPIAVGHPGFPDHAGRFCPALYPDSGPGPQR